MNGIQKSRSGEVAGAPTESTPTVYTRPVGCADPLTGIATRLAPVIMSLRREIRLNIARMVSSRADADIPRLHAARRAADSARADPALHPRRGPSARASARSRRAGAAARRVGAAGVQDEGGRALGAGRAGAVRRRRARHVQYVRALRGDGAAPHGPVQHRLRRLRPLSAARDLGGPPDADPDVFRADHPRTMP